MNKNLGGINNKKSSFTGSKRARNLKIFKNHDLIPNKHFMAI